MGAGNLVGLVFNMGICGFVWMVLGGVVDRIGTVFNTSMKLLPSIQDAVTGFSLMQALWGILLIIIYIALIINYILNENSQISGAE